MSQISPKIALVANTARSLSLFRGDLIRHYTGKGVEVYCLAPPDSAAQAELQAMGARFVPVEMSRSGMQAGQEMRLILTLWKALRDIRPDAVISYTIKPNSYVPPLAKMLGIPSIAVATGLGYAFMAQNVRARVAACVFLTGLSQAGKIWFLNGEDRDAIAALRPALAAKMDILPGEGIDTDHFAAQAMPDRAAGEKTVFLLIARLLKDKGVREYVEAAQIIRAAGHKAEFRVLGDLDPGNPSALSREAWAKMVQDGDVVHLGSASDVRPFIAQADCVVLPSYREGLPRVLLEAGAMGRPVIATDVAGCRDVVRGGENGFLCKAQDTDSLARALEMFLEMDSAERAQMAAAARQRTVDVFSSPIVLAQYDAALKL